MKKLIEFFKNGLAIESRELSAEDKGAMQGIAARAGAFAFPMLLFAEALRPVAGLLPYFFAVAEPVADAVIKPAVYRKLSRLFSQPKSVETLIDALQEKGF